MDVLESWCKAREIPIYHICIISHTDAYMWHLPAYGLFFSPCQLPFCLSETPYLRSAEFQKRGLTYLTLCKLKFKDPSPWEDSLLHLSSEAKRNSVMESANSGNPFRCSQLQGCQKSPQGSCLGSHWELFAQALIGLVVLALAQLLSPSLFANRVLQPCWPVAW